MSSLVELPPPPVWRALVELALAEDIGPGDVTTALVVPAGAAGAAAIEARQDLVVCGLDVARSVFAEVDAALAFTPLVSDGQAVGPGTELARIEGSLRGLLVAERTALNFLMRMCGVATHTRRYVEAVSGTGADIVDTRKTIPGWRALDKYAAAIGGARNHRFGLFDGILLKDNHLAAAGGVVPAVKAALASAPAGLRVQVEVESESEALAAIEAGADFLLLDNCPPPLMRRIADQLGERALLEASGGVHLETVREIAECGVHRISIGALTHSVPAADVALEIRDASPPTGTPAGAATG